MTALVRRACTAVYLLPRQRKRAVPGQFVSLTRCAHRLGARCLLSGNSASTAAPSGCRASPPPLPSMEEVHQHGLPLLRKAAQHAREGRILLRELPQHGAKYASYREVLDKSSTVTDFLRHKLPHPGGGSRSRETHRVAHLCHAGSEYVASLWGTWAAGYCSVPLALSHRTPELWHVLADAKPDVILVGGGEDANEPPNEINLFEAAQEADMSDRLVHIKSILEPKGKHRHPNTPEHGGDSDDEQVDEFQLGADGLVPDLEATPALILYTSGTTGKPKGVLSTHANVYHQMTDLVAAWEWQPSDVALHMLPLHHVHGLLNILSCAAYAGASCEFHTFSAVDIWKRLAQGDDDDDGASSAPAAAAAVSSRRPNVLMAVPTIYAKLLEAAENHSIPKKVVDQAVERSLKPMRLMVSGSAALPISILQKWKDLTGHTLLERYGMTEFAMALSNPYHPVEGRMPGHVGRPLPSVQVRLVDPDTKEVDDGGGGESNSGELRVKGPTVFREYINRPDATAEAFDQEGYFKTGDIAEYNAELGSYRILGRESVDIIKSGGHKLSALEIERVLLEHPDLQEVVVLGVPDEVWGERVGVLCRMKQGVPAITLEELRPWCNERMANYKNPSKIVVVQEIPKNAMGKVNKKELQSFFEEKHNK